MKKDDSPFKYLNAILQNKEHLITDEQSEDEYNPYLTNRGLSYHNDCIMFANEMNRRSFLDKKMQFEFLINTIRSKKRPFAKWVKPEKNDDLKCVKQIYHYSDAKARDALRLLTEDQIKQLKEKADFGGMGK